MDELKGVLVATIDIISKTTKFFNQQRDKEAYKELEVCIIEITKTMDLLYISNQNGTNLQDRFNKIENILVIIFQAMQGDDTMLIADILQYELAPEFKDIIDNIC